MSIAAVGNSNGQQYTPPVRTVKPATQPAQPQVAKTDSDGDHDGDTGSKGGRVDVKA